MGLKVWAIYGLILGGCFSSFADTFQISANKKLLLKVANHTGLNDLTNRLQVRGRWDCGLPGKDLKQISEINSTGSLKFEWLAGSDLQMVFSSDTVPLKRWLKTAFCKATIYSGLQVEPDRFVSNQFSVYAWTANTLSQNLAKIFSELGVYYLKARSLVSPPSFDFMTSGFGFSIRFNGDEFSPREPFGSGLLEKAWLESNTFNNLSDFLPVHAKGRELYLPEVFWIGSILEDHKIRKNNTSIVGSNGDFQLLENSHPENLYETISEMRVD